MSAKTKIRFELPRLEESNLSLREENGGTQGLLHILSSIVEICLREKMKSSFGFSNWSFLLDRL